MRGSFVELDDLLCRIEAGKSPMADDVPAGHGEWGVLKVSAIQGGRFVARENKAVRDASLIQPLYEVRPGDLLMTRANTEELVGLACVAVAPPPRLMLSDKTLRLVVNESLADPAFLALVLAQPSLRQRIRSLATGTSGSMKNIGQEQIRRLPVPDISLAEQRRIVAAYEAIERRIAVLERVCDKRRTVQSALIARSSVPGNRRIPLKSWLQRIEAGKSPLAEGFPAGPGEWGVLRVSAVQAGRFVARENKVLRDPSLISPQYEVREGDLLMTRANTEDLVGLACVAHQPPPRLMMSDKTLRLVLDESVAVAAYVEAVLASSEVRVQIKAAATGTSGSMKNIGQAAIERLAVPDVPVHEQRRVSDALLWSRKQVEVLGRQIEKLHVVQQGLVEDLLSGRVRVPLG
ncbi:hypothetical protein OG594_30535 [Streptomyces sp. NBC_01214]|uniref:restriction endonuclease subunit S n=1 Tax=Streptomyces sp. NBC_01214 TaxID=2903777 RepID=UPI002251C245|nr:hypothetical protein [Streptomyces sp. NBC_01214]MCX4805907.1 hypothetical protein [Streptomyces sp. NBC_01214]